MKNRRRNSFIWFVALALVGGMSCQSKNRKWRKISWYTAVHPTK